MIFHQRLVPGKNNQNLFLKNAKHYFDPLSFLFAHIGAKQNLPENSGLTMFTLSLCQILKILLSRFQATLVSDRRMHVWTDKDQFIVSFQLNNY